MSAVIHESTTAPLAEATAIAQVIERAASNPNVDIDKMERLLAMQERIMAKNAEAAFNLAMKDAQQEMPKIKRNKDNTQTNSKYADLEELNAKAVPIYTKHGFSLSFGTADCPIEGMIRITCLVSHISGHTRPYQCDMPLDMAGIKGTQNKTAVHGHGSTMSYGRRYLTMLIFNISLTNEDKDGNQPGDFITEKQAADINTMIQDTKADKAGLLRYFKADSVGTILAKDYPRVITALKKKQEQV